jgi:hypothetical protein
LKLFSFTVGAGPDGGERKIKNFNDIADFFVLTNECYVWKALEGFSPY